MGANWHNLGRTSKRVLYGPREQTSSHSPLVMLDTDNVHVSTLESSQAVVWLRKTSQAARSTVATQRTEVHVYKLNISMLLSAKECTLSASLAYLCSSGSCS